MTLDTLLVAMSLLLMPFSLISTFLLVREARRPPHIGALTERAFIASVIALMVITGTGITINRLTGYSIAPIEVARVLFLASLILLEFVPLIWTVLLWTRRLGDGGRGE